MLLLLPSLRVCLYLDGRIQHSTCSSSREVQLMLVMSCDAGLLLDSSIQALTCLDHGVLPLADVLHHLKEDLGHGSYLITARTNLQEAQRSASLARCPIVSPV